MNYRNIIFIIGVLIAFLFSCTKQKVNSEFTISGELKGVNTSSIKIAYIDKDNNIIIDTIAINDGSFFIKGLINGATYISIKGNIKSSWSGDNNRMGFFIEPTKNSIILTENKFKDAIISGTYTQEEFQNLSELVEPFYSEISDIIFKINELKSKNENWEKDSIVITQLNKLYKENDIELLKIKDVRLNFVAKHPNSYLSPYWVNFYRRTMSLDSLKTFYSALNYQVKSSTLGINLNKNISSREAVSAGNLAPNLNLIDINGNNLDLKSFKGKFVLLDFWAGWCKPCIDGIPELKQLFHQYNKKGLEIISISLDKDKSNWIEAVQQHNLTIWNNGFIGYDDMHKEGIYKDFNVPGIPSYILIDNNGFIVGRYLESENGLGINDLKNTLEENLNN